MADVSTFITLQELEKTSRPTAYGPGASSGVRAPFGPAMHRQIPLPPTYRELSSEELETRIQANRALLCKDLVILGHHYQRDEVIRHADFRGDSFKLSQLAAESQARYIVFCGVYFMAESADVLTGSNQTVILPNLTAGCSMADMANLADVSAAWNSMTETFGNSIVPVTYMNSSAHLKAFCGEHGGIVCTSSNASAILSWAFDRGQRVLFFPDEHLGRNTADRLEMSPDAVSVWDPRDIETSLQEARNARLTVWKGFCSVHERFTVGQIQEARERYPDCTVIVHPECRREVVHAADASGSTEYIVAEIERASPGSVLAIGTEVNLVNRLAQEHPEMTIFCLDPVVCPCSTMYRIHPAYLAWVLDNLVAGTVVNRVEVEPQTAGFARLALNRMLSVTENPAPTSVFLPLGSGSMAAAI